MIQVSAGGRDFRSLYKKTVRPVLLKAAAARSVPWQPSADPFVSNPFREPSIDAAWVERRQGRLAGAQELNVLVSYITAMPADAYAVLGELARHERRLLERSAIIYRIPPRLSTAVAITLLASWLASDSGGRRHEGASIALLRFAGPQLGTGWTTVDSHDVNDPTPYDALCKAGDIIRVVAEVKAQDIRLDHVRQLVTQMDIHRARRGYLFTRAHWLPPEGSMEAAAITTALRDQDALGRRIDILDVLDSIRLWLPLLDQSDQALPAFVQTLTRELDDHGVYADRRALAKLLEEL
jgi:hypothetical protein